MAFKVFQWHLGFTTITLTAGVLAYPVTFVLTDVIHEVWGARAARTVATGAGLASLGAALTCYLADRFLVGYNPNMDAMFHLVLGQAPRTVAASLTAFYVGNMIDIAVFQWVRRRFGGPFWLRKNASTLVSQLVDSALFCTMAFAGILPWSVLLWMVPSQWLVKFAASPVLTPVSEGALWAFRRYGTR